MTFKPTLAHSRSTSIVLPAPTTFDLVDGEVVATNVQPTPEPVAGQIEWAYEVTFKDRHSKTYSFLVGVPDSTTQVNFTSLPRYFETKPPLFGEGPKGEPGEAATVAVGTVTGGDTAQVSNSGTNTDAVLDFVLPKGDKGDTGAGVPTGGTALQVVRKNSANTATEWATLTKALVGLSNVDNTSDASKPVSAPQKTYIDQSNTLAYGTATLPKVPSEYPEGVTIANGHSGSGWPTNGYTGYVQVRTERARATSSAIQYVYNTGELTVGQPDTTSVFYRRGGTNDVWGAWQELVTGATLVRMLGNRVFNVLDYGAARDGVTSDVTPINNAILAAEAAGGGTVIMPSGEYYMNSFATLKSNVTVEGSGNTILQVDGGGTGAKFAILSNGSVGYGSGGKNITLRNLIFRGSIANNRGIGALGANHGSNILIEDCTFIEAHRVGHIIDLQGCDGVIIRRCKFFGANYSGATADLTGEAIQLDYSSKLGASVIDAPGSYDGLPTRNVIVEDCEFLPIYVGGTLYPAPNPLGSHFTVGDYYIENVIFRNNVVDRPWEDTVNFLRGALHFVATKGIQIYGNTFKGTTNRSQRLFATYGLTTTGDITKVNETGHPTIPLSVPKVCSGIDIYNNTFTGFGTSLVSNELMYISGQNTDGYVDNVRVTGNTFIGCYPPGSSENIGAHIIYPRFASNTVIRDNVADRARRLVFFGTVKNLQIISNTLGFSGAAGDVNGSSAIGLTVKDNSFMGTGLGIYVGTNSTDVTISGNRLETRVDTTSVIDVNGVKKYTITENIIDCPTTVARGIVARGDSDPGIIKNNIVTGAAAALVMDASSTPINSDNILV